jgi:hypothetical protein
MLYREIIALLSHIHTKQIHCGQNVELLNVKLAVRIVITRLYRVKAAGLGIFEGTGKRHLGLQFQTG